MRTVCYQVNLQKGWGGGEVYTTFFTRALAAAGVRTVLFAHPEASHWAGRLPGGCEIVPVEDAGRIAEKLPKHERCLLVYHTPAGESHVAPLRAAGHFVTCFAHMPLYGRDPASLRPYELVVPVSQHVLNSLRAAGIASGYSEPLYGVADLSGRNGGATHSVTKKPPYDWDLRKGRDRLLSLMNPVYDRFRPHPTFERKPGITLGIVSRLTPIKQFPLLFKHLAPVLARYPEFNLEIFGSGGYASVRDLRRALAPVRGRVRFWGQQQDVGSIYRLLDYLLTGLPEKEALGLNVIEAQACGTPVLAVDAPPFTETVAAEVTGLLYTDPRKDEGRSFNELLGRITATPFKLDTQAATSHLQRFSESAFYERIGRLVKAADAILSSSKSIQTGP